MAQTYLTKTFSSSGNLDVWTVSFWVKKSIIVTGNDQYVMHAQTDADNQTGIVLRGSGDNYQLQCFNAVSASANNGFNVYTSMYFRDPSAWYHVVVACDTTESSGSNGLKIYVNGTQQTVTVGAWNQNVDTQFSKNQQHVIGAKTGNSLGFGGYLSQFIFANGTQYAASTFGSTDASLFWIPNSSPSVTYGSNGFQLLFTGTGASADSSGFGADTSGNNNHFASNNLGTNPNTKDGPANNFSTMNPVAGTGVSMNKGALTFSGNYNSVSSFGVYDGKWYCEMKITNTNTYNPMIGIAQGYTDIAQRNVNNYPGQVTDSYGINREGNLYVNGSNSGSQGFTLAQNDIVGVALDLASGTKNIKFYKNGSQVVSQNLSETLSDPYVFVTYASTSQAGTGEWNFGNPPFAIASSNSDANGYGSFEYAVPSGYYALCSKNLGQYG